MHRGSAEQSRKHLTQMEIYGSGILHRRCHFLHLTKNRFVFGNRLMPYPAHGGTRFPCHKNATCFLVILPIDKRVLPDSIIEIYNKRIPPLYNKKGADSFLGSTAGSMSRQLRKAGQFSAALH